MFSQIATQFSDIRRILKIGAFCTALSGGHYCSSSSSSSYFELANFRSIAETETESAGRGRRRNDSESPLEETYLNFRYFYFWTAALYTMEQFTMCIYLSSNRRGKGLKKALNLSPFKKEPHAGFFWVCPAAEFGNFLADPNNELPKLLPEDKFVLAPAD